MIKLDGKKVRFLAQERKYITDPYPAVAPLDSVNNIFITGQHYEANDKDRQGFLTQAEITGEQEIRPAARAKRFSPLITETSTVMIIHNKQYDCTMNGSDVPNNPKDYWDAHFIIAQRELVAPSKTKATVKHLFYLDDKDEEAKHFVISSDAKYEAEKLIREKASIDEYKDVVMLLNLSTKDFHVDWKTMSSTRLKEVLLRQAATNPDSVKFAFSEQGKDVLFMAKLIEQNIITRKNNAYYDGQKFIADSHEKFVSYISDTLNDSDVSKWGRLLKEAEAEQMI